MKNLTVILGTCARYIMCLYIKQTTECQGLNFNEDRLVHQGCWLLSSDLDDFYHKDHVLASCHLWIHQSSNTTRKQWGMVHKSTNIFYLAPHHYKLLPRSLYSDNSLIAIPLSLWPDFHHLVDKQSNHWCLTWSWILVQCSSKYSSLRHHEMTHWVEDWWRLEHWLYWQASLDGGLRHCLTS